MREQGLEVADSIVKMQHHIKEVGTTEVKLKFAEELVVSVSVVVVAEGQDPAEPEEPAEGEEDSQDA